jgi:hypothetical protein
MKPLRHTRGLAAAVVMFIASLVFALEGAQASTVADLSQISLIRQAETFVTTPFPIVTSPIPPNLGQGTWRTSLQPRDWTGNGPGVDAFYDTILNITWLADPDFAITSGFDADGLMTLAQANAWADGLSLFGGDGWRLPRIFPVSGLPLYNHNFSNNGTTDRGTAATGVGWGGASELGYMFYVHLGNKGIFTPNDANPSAAVGPQPGYGLSNRGPFANLRAEAYLTLNTVGDSDSVVFAFQNGFQSTSGRQHFPQRAWLLHPGDLIGAAPASEQLPQGSIVPLPGGLLLLGSALTVLPRLRARTTDERAR